MTVFQKTKKSWLFIKQNFMDSQKYKLNIIPVDEQLNFYTFC
jgi:hypothetical protein